MCRGTCRRTRARSYTWASASRDKAFEWLNKALVARDVHLIYLPVDPKWDEDRSDPRFVGLLAKCGFPVSR